MEASKNVLRHNSPWPSLKSQLINQTGNNIGTFHKKGQRDWSRLGLYLVKLHFLNIFQINLLHVQSRTSSLTFDTPHALQIHNVSCLCGGSTHLPDCDILFPYWACWRGSLIGFHAGKSFRPRMSSTTSGTGSILLQNGMFSILGIAKYSNRRYIFLLKINKYYFSCTYTYTNVMNKFIAQLGYLTIEEPAWSVSGRLIQMPLLSLQGSDWHSLHKETLRRILQSLKMFTRFSNSRNFTGNAVLYTVLISSNIQHHT